MADEHPFPFGSHAEKGPLGTCSSGRQGRHRGCSLKRWTPKCLRGSTAVGPQGRDTTMEFAPGCFTLAAASFLNFCRPSPLQSARAICPGCAGGDKETPTAPTGDAAFGNCYRSPLCFNHTFPLLLFPYHVPEAALHGATVTELTPPPQRA